MPSPIGHSLTGYIIYRLSTRSVAGGHRRLIPLYLLAANAADLDFLPGLLIGDPNRYHHGISHSIGFAALFALVFSLFQFLLKRDVARWWGDFAILFCLYGSHIALDYFAVDGSFPHGVAVFWPVSGEYYLAPVALFLDIQRSPAAIEFVPSLFSRHNFLAASIEVLLLLPFVLLNLYGLPGGGVARRAGKSSPLMRFPDSASPQAVCGGETPPRNSNT